ncbi:interferon-induced very large GTPase 1-like [Lytechinus pictus]|uniref:interferon-induced very large GTPase 1-like n=1 Tax=Lytechinus pictus TaxID=7653 RepID=UPI0030B9C138
MTDFHARGHLLSDLNKSSREERRNEGGVFDLEALLEMQNTSVGSENNETMNLNPLDVMVAIFTCCDNFLKQTLAQKLFICKLAIPFLYPLGSEGKVGMSLWALRTITVQRQTEKNCISKSSVTDKYFPVVTFVRLGRAPLSKSKLMNDILKDDGHDTFFHKDCLNGTVTRRITNGLVECFWFIALDGQKDHLPETTTILNLRGDASVMKKQMQILQEISSVIFVSATDQELATPQNTNTFQQILQTNAKVILLLICGKHEQGTLACFETIGKDFIKAVSIILSRTKDGIRKNASVLKTEAREKLSEAISGCSGAVLEECALRVREMGIIIDEYDDEACLEGKVLADNVVSNVKDMNIADCKNLLLPLQGPYWIENCNMLKRLHRTAGQGTQSSSHHADELKQKMKLLREKQVEICKNGLTPFIKDFMSTLQKNGDVMYFLRWIDLYLNEHQLANASFGMENIFRELGQIYEAMNGSGKEEQDTGVDVEYLPEIAAKLLVKGIPLELVDGDSSSIHIVWVSAVLRQLGNIIGEKRLFVLSILGIQSSGKSTLLNTMFGLQFAVSAGGCTKGAYMQLIPVDKHADLPFDYVVVVDTEGLRAPGLGQLKYEPDNKLATLVFGLGNVNMIHIKRELSEEMTDVLQIVVHAFLRMNRARKHTRGDKTCIFLHQNTPEANAEEMRHGCLKVQGALNDRTKEAALCENLKNIYLFSQIVNFDVEEHVWFFPDLWHGNPLKARANPAYCEKVAALRSNVLGEIAKGQKAFLTSSDLSIHLADLWNRILDDDFVFRFRNSLEMKSHNSMQSNYYTLEMN